ncbi:hypothetical protein EJ07DRAFT_159179 [Lizonia empirigonia]|nr:hypothetical protein EJ07DRAFT_159179 [Lizonia empirigonia]
MDQFSRRNSRAYSTLSADQRTIPRTTPSSTRRGGTRATSITSDAAPTETPGTTRIPPHYLLAPTVPSPFAGTLESSLDAILFWKRSHPLTTKVADVLLRPVSETTNWPSLLPTLFGSVSALEADLGRLLLEDLLFLVTRTLLPEQIAENRAAMARLYHEKNHSSVRLVLSNRHPHNQRRPLMPNVWATLIAAPDGGWRRLSIRERMKHYITPLDEYLLLSDDEVRGWNVETLVVRASQIVLQWQWLRQKNEKLDEMEFDGWEELDGRADQCEWIAEKREANVV